jgi:hypothetical protein
MSLLISDKAERLEITVEGSKKVFPVKWAVLLGVGMIGGVIGGIINGEGVLLITFFLIFFGLVSYQVTELHFDKNHKAVYIVYSLFDKIMKKRKLLDDYSAYQYSIHFERITPVEDTYEVYTLRATGYYYYHNLYHFQTLEEAEIVGHCLTKKLGITLEEGINNSAQHSVDR